MSVDDRLREAFSGDDPSWEAVNHALPEVHREADRRARRRRMVVAAAVVALIVTAVRLNPGSDDVVPAPEPNVQIQGRWQAAGVTEDLISQNLAAAGLEEWTDEVLRELPPPPVTYILAVDENQVKLSVRGEGLPVSSEQDVQAYTLDGFDLEMRPLDSGASTTYTVAITRGQLRFSFVDTTEGETNGVPGEAMQRALYTLAAFDPVR